MCITATAHGEQEHHILGCAFHHETGWQAARVIVSTSVENNTLHGMCLSEERLCPYAIVKVLAVSDGRAEL